MKKFCNIFIFLSIFLICCDETFSLRINKLSIPKSVKLECDYDLEGETLYYVKWYKDRREFYRYAPGELPTGKTFLMSGIKVNLEKSTDRIVSLELIDEHVAGIYACEVTAEGPSFSTVIETKEFNYRNKEE